jgi:predicted transglutaminase-like cysteine proteinase
MAALPAQATQPLPRPIITSPIVQTTQQALPPLAHVRFCAQYPDQCLNYSKQTGFKVRAELTLAELAAVNGSVNRTLIPQVENADIWSLNTERGDCEDYALLKRQQLLEMGWSSSSLRIATALTQGGTGHAVLIVRLNNQDVVLDNLTDAIRPWYETEYRFLKIQSDTDPNAWFAVENPKASPRQISS